MQSRGQTPHPSATRASQTAAGVREWVRRMADGGWQGHAGHELHLTCQQAVAALEWILFLSPLTMTITIVDDYSAASIEWYSSGISSNSIVTSPRAVCCRPAHSSTDRCQQAQAQAQARPINQISSNNTSTSTSTSTSKACERESGAAKPPSPERRESSQVTCTCARRLWPWHCLNCCER